MIMLVRVAAGLFIFCAGLLSIHSIANRADSDSIFWKPVPVTTTPHNLSRLKTISPQHYGKLIYRGGIQLTSSAKNFGGFSGLHITSDGTSLLALSDRAQWLRATLDYDDAGALIGASNAMMAPVTNADGNPLPTQLADSEGLDVSGNEILISFERSPRIDKYSLDEDGIIRFKQSVMSFGDIASLRSNKSLEGVTRINDHTIIATIERRFKQHPKKQTSNNITINAARVNISTKAYDRRNPDENRAFFSITPTPPLEITDIGHLDGTLYLSERYYSRKRGLQVRLSSTEVKNLSLEIPAITKTLADFTLLQNIDNFEGLSVHTTHDGRTILYIISDDNFSTRQKTLLLMFEVPAAS